MTAKPKQPAPAPAPTATASVRLEGSNADRFAVVRDHMTGVLPGLNPTSTDVLKTALAIAASAIDKANQNAGA